MSWSHWQQWFSDSDLPRFNALYRFLKSDGKTRSFAELAQIGLDLCVARLLAKWKAAGLPTNDPQQTLQNDLGFSPSIAKALCTVISPDSASDFRSVHGDEFVWPSMPDLAAPLLDALVPRHERLGQGFFCTPPPLIGKLMAALKIRNAKSLRLLDVGCGTGSLILAAMERQPASEGIEQWAGIESDTTLAAIASVQFLDALTPFRLAAKETMDHWPIICADALSVALNRSFSHAVANPPYIGEKKATGALSRALSQDPDLSAAYKGKSDYWYLFLLYGLNNLEENGRLAFLAPAYWPTADGASTLRKTLNSRAVFESFEFVGSAIPSAPGIETAIFALVKRNPDSAIPKKLTITRDGKTHIRNYNSTISDNAPWRFIERSDESDWLDAMEKNSVGLASDLGPFFVHAGIQTGADRVTAHLRKTYGLKHPIGSGIFVVNDSERDLLLDGEKKNKPPIVPLYKSPACGPFILSDTPVGWLLYLDGSIPINDLPIIREHLDPFRSLLASRRECRMDRMPWWRLHWPRNQEIFTSPSLLVPQRASLPRFAYAPNGAFTSVDVYHLLPRDERTLSLFGWLGFLHSAPVAFWLKRRGKRKGDLLELYSTPLSRLPVPLAIEKNIANELNVLGKQIHQLMDNEFQVKSKSQPWHQIWARSVAEKSIAFNRISSLLSQIDHLAANIYGLDEQTLKQIQTRLQAA